MEEEVIYDQYSYLYITKRGQKHLVTVRANRPSEQALDDYAKKVLELFEEHERKRILQEAMRRDKSL